ncbi:alanine racemase [Mycoavidus sp. B2-EB]|uniref:alanine racemase n=1 Tax=Mycoavidus sp. B2-EB TaxID=2651972 RepID=UPI0016278613|nr:alanine racemase [Mycoavidus sp. B2-EB]BBO59663.1 alanine racemase [Mycoavidus sp. B2-EB]
MPRPISAAIDLTALAHNLATIRRLVPQSKIWSIVKANAYGHGLAQVLPGLCKTDGFGVLDLDAAIKLRELGWAGPILLLEGFFHTTDLEAVDRYSLATIIHSDEQLHMLAATRLTKPVNIQLKMNTGMNRLGYRPEFYQAAWQRARACPNIGQITLMTHFSDADNGRGVEYQMGEFERGAKELTGPRCLANSAAVLWHARTHTHWVRPGILLYGASPSGVAAVPANYGFLPVMTLTSEIVAVQTLVPGDTVGYGSSYKAEKPMRIGVVACGYADGYPRTAPSGTPIMVDHIRTQLVGRVSMDMITVDLTALPTARIGSKVQLWGAELPVDEVAQACGTVGYELLCALAPRVSVV